VSKTKPSPAKKVPSSGLNWGKLLHTYQNALLPLVVAYLVYRNLVPAALLLVLLGKWRIFAVQPRHWLANLRTNTPDLIVGLSFLTFMVKSTTDVGLALAAVLYAGWLLFIKPSSSTLMVGLQAMLSQLLGLTALFWYADNISETILVLASWLIAVLSARHFLSAFEEPLSRIMSLVWGLFVAQLTWLLNRWLIVYTILENRNIIVPQIVLIVGAISYMVASLYYLYHQQNLRKQYIRRYLAYTWIILIIIIIFSDWSAEL